MLSITRTRSNPSLLGGLGIIPDWQFNPDPMVNYALSRTMVMPDGMTQLTVQPVGDYVAGVSYAGSGLNPPGSGILNGLGITMVGKPLAPFVSSLGCVGIGCSAFDSPYWKNRKWLALGALGLVAVAVVAVLR